MTTRSGDRSLLRRMNLLATLRSAGDRPKTIAAFAAATGLSRTAAEAVVLDLVERGWLVEDGQEGHPGAGRPARHYRVRSESGILLGMDIGPHNIVVTVADILGEPLTSLHRTVDPALGTQARLTVAIDAAEQALEAVNRDRTDVWVAAVGTPGIVHHGRIEQLMGGDNGPDPNLAVHLKYRLGCPVLLENDCNLAAVAERWRGVARAVDDMVFVLSGNRTSAGLLLAGKLYRGHSGGAGEIGALARLGWHEAPAHLEALRTDGQPLRREEVFALAAQGDPEASAAVEAFSQGLAFGISALALALDPEVVVIGGGIVRAGETLLTPLRRYVSEYTYSRISTIQVSSLGNQSVSLGAVRFALDAIDEFLEANLEFSSSFPTPEASSFADIDAPTLRTASTRQS